MIAEHLPRIALAHLPTPIEELPRLRQALRDEVAGMPVPRLLIKRDDQTGLAMGGNKARKLEFLVAEALQQEADTLITAGAPQSNHCRQTAAAAAKMGLRCLLVLGGPAPMLEGGNLLLDRMLGAEVVWVGERDRSAVMAEVAEKARRAGGRPYVVPYGGSNAVGAAAYAAAFQEMHQQASAWDLEVDQVVVASSSGGTQAGMLVGARAMGSRTRINGISIDKKTSNFQAELVALADATATLLDLELELPMEEFIVHDSYLGGGYGVVGEPERSALSLLAATEGLLLDPVYTARALAGLRDLVRRGHFREEETVLFWHTGGLPALFAYADLLGPGQ